MKKIAFLFPGQGAQYLGMGKELLAEFPLFRHTFQEAEDRLHRKLIHVMLDGPESELVKTDNSQLLVYIFSVALARLVQQLYPKIRPFACAGLSLGEYSALTVSGRLLFVDGITLVERRATFMREACEKTLGTMAVIMGLPAEEVEAMVLQAAIPHDLWAANFNCPGQVVISGTLKGIEKGIALAKERGAKRVVPLAVQGAFHSGLMRHAQERLTPYLEQVPLQDSPIRLAMNIPGACVENKDKVRQYLIAQVTEPVRWESSIRALDKEEVQLFLEIGPGSTLTGMNRKMGLKGTLMHIENREQLCNAFA